jgi:lantibiotic modifying enzyme
MNEAVSISTNPDAYETLPGRADDMSRRQLLRFVGVAAVVAGTSLLVNSCDSAPSTPIAPHPEMSLSTSPSDSEQAEQNPDVKFLLEAATSLLSHGEPSHGGLRFQSEIQSPHYQTDRDVGASSVGMGFLVLAKQYPTDARWLDAARKTATWLEAVSSVDKTGGRSWPDYADDDDVSESRYTSADDGTLGVGDFFFQLYDQTHDPKDKEVALQAAEWTFAHAENVGTHVEPMYRWRWDETDKDKVYYMGMGEGLVGTIHTFASYYERTKDTDPAFAARCKQYVDGSLRYMQTVQNALGNNSGDARALPETAVIGQDGDTTMNSGYLSGSAGAAFMYLKLHQVFGDKNYLQKADQLLSWLDDNNNGPKVAFSDGSAAWKLELDHQGDDNTQYATGMEEGNAGIGWVYLQAYLATGEKKYLSTAKQAASWLITEAVHDGKGGMSWPEDEHPTSKYIHPNLNNGAAGIGMFLKDMHEATQDVAYLNAAHSVQTWLTNTALCDGNGNVKWADNDDGTPFSGDPSWHWGSAGIIAFLVRMQGGTTDVPGEQSGIRAKT